MRSPLFLPTFSHPQNNIILVRNIQAYTLQPPTPNNLHYAVHFSTLLKPPYTTHSNGPWNMHMTSFQLNLGLWQYSVPEVAAWVTDWLCWLSHPVLLVHHGLLRQHILVSSLPSFLSHWLTNTAPFPSQHQVWHFYPWASVNTQISLL